MIARRTCMPAMLVVLLVLVTAAMAILSIVESAAAPGARQASVKKITEARCWPGIDERLNADRRRRLLPRLPARLAREPVKQRAIALKLCVDENGKVARTIVVISTGNSKIDQFYRTAAEEWTFEPLRKQGSTAPSVVKKSLVWNGP